MDGTDELGIEVRVTDGKGPRESYNPSVVRRARLEWVIGRKDKEIERAMGLTDGIVRMWRFRRYPDGKDWHAFKESLAIAPVERVLDLVGPGDERELRLHWLQLSQRLMGAAMSALERGVLYDSADEDERRVVRVLYDEDGRKVSMSGLAPRSTTQLVGLVNAAAKLGEDQIEALRSAEEGSQSRRVLFQRWWAEMRVLVRDEFGEDGVRRLEARAGEHGGSGLDGSGVSEGDDGKEVEEGPGVGVEFREDGLEEIAEADGELDEADDAEGDEEIEECES
jgi:hypothetical protein